MRTINFTRFVKKAWKMYDPSRKISEVYDASPNVSTNHVFKIFFEDGGHIFAKLSYYGKFEHFKEDHTIINVLVNKLPSPYKNFFPRSLTKDGEVFMQRIKEDYLDIWVVFYQAVTIQYKLPRQLEKDKIIKMGSELAKFHKACSEVNEQLPPSSKTLKSDIEDLLQRLDTDEGKYEFRGQDILIREQCHIFLENIQKLNYESISKIPVFIDWNIGNFSITSEGEFFSRWDYDWFRIASRVMDFYFFSRVVSEIGDRTIFSYLVDTLMEERFILFLQEYHRIFPLQELEVRFIKEAYRFFILNYVVKEGRYFFHEIYFIKLRKEAYERHLPRLDELFNVEKLLKALSL